MAKRPDHDEVLIESIQGGDFSIVIDRATQYEIVTDLRAPSVARFELGDDGTWSAMATALKIGTRVQVSVNGRPRITGRMLTRNLAVSSDAGATVQVVVRTTLADAMFTSVDAKIGVQNATLKDVVLSAFKKLGLTEKSFIFKEELARNLLTGKSSKSPAPPELTKLKLEDARPSPPETVWQFVDRHISRFGLMMWDSPDGRVVIGKPNDTQAPTYLMTCRRGLFESRTNNLLSAQKTEDYEEVPAKLWVFGSGGKRDQSRAKIKFLRSDEVLSGLDPAIDRTVVIIDDAITNRAQAEARARREMANRSLAKNSWLLETDGLSYWTGSQQVEYSIGTVADVHVDVAGAASGPYLIWQVTQKGDAENGQTTTLASVGKGVWQI